MSAEKNCFRIEASYHILIKDDIEKHFILCTIRPGVCIEKVTMNKWTVGQCHSCWHSTWHSMFIQTHSQFRFNVTLVCDTDLMAGVDLGGKPSSEEHARSEMPGF